VKSIQEREIASDVAAYLRAEGYRVRTEVSLLGQSADLVATRGRWVTTVEVKHGHWRRALRQCTAHELVADFVLIAIHARVLSAACIDAAAQLGYGVIHHSGVDHTVRLALRPRRNLRLWSPQRHLWAKSLRNVETVDEH